MFCWQKTILRMRPAVPPVRFCMLMINNTSCATFSANWSSVVRMCLLCSLNITYHKLYLHVFSPNISIRTSRHKHPHYVLMWRRIQFSCQQAGAEMWSVPDTMRQFSKLLSPPLKLPAGTRWAWSVLPAFHQAAYSSSCWPRPTPRWGGGVLLSRLRLTVIR